MVDEIKVKTVNSGSFVGPIWCIGWLFTIGFLKLTFWKGFLALILWPYYLGAFLHGPATPK